MQTGVGTPWGTKHRVFCDALSACPGEEPPTKASRNRVIHTPAALVLGVDSSRRHLHLPGGDWRNPAVHCFQRWSDLNNSPYTDVSPFTCLTLPTPTLLLPEITSQRNFQYPIPFLRLYFGGTQTKTGFHKTIRHCLWNIWP